MNNNVEIEQPVNIKQRIARQFSRAASQYDGAALVQSDIAFDALSLIKGQYQHILDIGCGTGRVTQALAEKGQHTFALDLAEGMVQFAQAQTTQPIYWCTGDAEALPFAKKSMDLVFSTMALQWCNNPDDVMMEIQRVLKSGGQGILAIMCEGSFAELNYSWSLLDSRSHTNRFPSVGGLLLAAAKAGLSVKSHNKSYLTWHRDIRSLLGSIKSIGANVEKASANHNRLNRSSLADLQKVYQKLYGENNRLPLTYEVCFLALRKELG